MRRNCLQGKDGDAKSDVAQAKAPWGAVLGTFSYKWSYRCTTCGVESQACLSHHYDFDFKGFLATHRALDAEFKVLLIAYSQGLLGCDWRPYGIKGCTYKAIEC